MHLIEVRGLRNGLFFSSFPDKSEPPQRLLTRETGCESFVKAALVPVKEESLNLINC